MTLFALIVVVVVDIGVQKWRGIDRLEERENRTWALTYWFLAGFMSAGAVGIYAAARSLSHGFSSHRTFILEAWMIGWLAIFWLLQTWERRTDGRHSEPMRSSIAWRPRQGRGSRVTAQIRGWSDVPPSSVDYPSQRA